MAGDAFIRGVGYVYQGLWLGSDPAAMKPIEIDRDDVSLIERQDDYARIILKTGHTVILYQIDERPRAARVVTATSSGSQDSPPTPTPRRIIYLPPPRDEKDEK